MSRHIANNASPKILDYQTSSNTGYTYAPASNDFITQPMPVANTITQQQRFNAIADQLMYTNNSINNNDNAITKDINVNRGSVIDSLINAPQNTNSNTVNNSTALLNTTAPLGKLNMSNEEKKESFGTNENDEKIKPDTDKLKLLRESQNKLNIIGVILVCFIIFMLIQLYLSQKKLEFMMNIYTSSRPGIAAIPQSQRNEIF